MNEDIKLIKGEEGQTFETDIDEFMDMVNKLKEK